ncbi:MAG: hypothetical protein ACE5EV_00890, partial [Gaiellales bacterium]
KRRETIRSRIEAQYRHPGFAKLLTLKLCNLLVAKFHVRHRHTVLASRPTQFTLDPSNACQLRCPGCVHSVKAQQGREREDGDHRHHGAYHARGSLSGHAPSAAHMRARR